MRAAEAVEVDQQAVPGALLLVAVAEGLEGEEGRAPGKGAHEVGVAAEHVKGGTLVLAGEEVGEDLHGVVVGLVAFED